MPQSLIQPEASVADNREADFKLGAINFPSLTRRGPGRNEKLWHITRDSNLSVF